MQKHGITNIRLVQAYDPEKMEADLVACWAWRPDRGGRHWAAMRTAQKSRGGHCMIMERAYVGERHTWVSLGYDGLNGHADFCNSDVNSLARFNRHFKNELQPWREGGHKVLIAGQCKGDASIVHVDIERWYERMVTTLKEAGHEVVFRDHPLNKSPWRGPCKFDKSATFQEALTDVKCVVTFNSNAGVLATLAGIPTITSDPGSMAYSITKHNLEDLNYRPDRSLWAARLAYTQWLPEELENGTAWEHLKRKFD